MFMDHLVTDALELLESLSTGRNSIKGSYHALRPLLYGRLSDDLLRHYHTDRWHHALVIYCVRQTLVLCLHWLNLAL